MICHTHLKTLMHPIACPSNRHCHNEDSNLSCRMTLLSVLQRTLGKKIPTTKSCRLVQLNHLCWGAQHHWRKWHEYRRLRNSFWRIPKGFPRYRKWQWRRRPIQNGIRCFSLKRHVRIFCCRTTSSSVTVTVHQILMHGSNFKAVG